jgi:hypothetical protein
MQAIVAGLGGHRPAPGVFRVQHPGLCESVGRLGGRGLGRGGAMTPMRRRSSRRRRCSWTPARRCVLRAAGLYGHGPGFLLRASRRGELSPREPLRYGNRIHRDDVAGFICLPLAGRSRTRKAACHESGRRRSRGAAGGRGLALRAAGAALRAARRRTRRGAPGHKRIRNARLHDSGYVLAYPDYRSPATPRCCASGWLTQSARMASISTDTPLGSPAT